MTDIIGGTTMDQISFYYLAFFLTIGSFLLGFVVSWNLKHVFDTWEEKADYAAEVIHPEMYDACLLYTSPSPRDKRQSRMPSSA